jgi:hypothetical protein
MAGGRRACSPAEFLTVSNFCAAFRPELLMQPVVTWAFTLDTNKHLASETTVFLGHSDVRKAKFTLGTEAAEVVYFSALEGFSHGAGRPAHDIPPKELERMAGHILLKTGLDTNALRRVRAKPVTISTRSKRQLFEVLWQRHEGGYEFRHDIVRLVLNSADGELLAFRKNWGQTPDALTAQISNRHALDTARAQVAAHARQTQGPRATVSGPVVVCPNTTFGVPSKHPGARRLAWVVEIPRQAGYKNAMEVWVDAGDGRVLGGETFW